MSPMNHAQSGHESAGGRDRSASLFFWKIVLCAATFSILLYAHSDGPASEFTGGFGEHTCVECHIGSEVNSGLGSVTINGVPTAYMSGAVYPLTVRVEDPDPSRQRWGFELSARTEAGLQAGSLAPVDDRTKLADSFNAIQYITHTLTGSPPGTPAGSDFLFNWTAPDTSAGPVVFHAAGNAANASLDEHGDRIYTTSVTVPPAPSAGPAPSVADGATVNNASFALHPAPLAPGSIAAIFGSNLNDGTPDCSSSFGPDGKLITFLCGASVTVNDIPAPLFYATPGQLGIQIPFELAGSPSADIVVTVLGQSSTPRTVFLDAAAPGIFTLNQAGTGPGAILIAISDVPTLAVATGSVPGATSRPARRGEFVTIYLTGLGVTSPPLATGEPSTTRNDTPTKATVTIDGLPAVVDFSGAAPFLVGMNQINVIVPENSRVADDVSVVVALETPFETKVSNTVTMAVGPAQ
jgi:uncharacterized protein (TIGR03437 family)